MRGKASGLTVAAWAAGLFVAGSVIAAVAREGSLTPFYTASWLIPVILGVTWSDRTGRCLPRRGRDRQAR